MKIGILSWVTWLPAVGSIILLFFNRQKNDAIRWFSNIWIVICFLISIPLLTGLGDMGDLRAYNRNLGGLQFIEDYEWIPLIGARYQLGIDGLSLVLVILTTLLGVIAVICSWAYIREKGREKEYYIMLLLLQTGMIGAFVAADLFLFFIFWEVMLVPMYFLIGIWGGKNRLYSAIKFFLYTLVGSLVMLLAVLKLYFVFTEVVTAQPNAVRATAAQISRNVATGQVNDKMQNLMLDAINRADPETSGSLPSGHVHSSFNIAALTAIGPHMKSVISINVIILMFIGFALSFAIKVPMFPFHTWLPDAHYDAPTAGSVILAGVLLKMGTYGFMRFSLPIFPDAASHPTVRQVMIVLSIIGIIYGALVAMAQKDVKKLIAYSSVSHLGFVMLGLFALNPNGINGAVMQMINHGISTGALFMLAGILYERRHTYEIAEFGGLAHKMPVFSTIFLIVTLSSLGLPLMNNFIGEFLTLRGAFEERVVWGAFATSGIIFGAAYMLWLYQRVFFGQITKPENENLKDLDAREAWQFAPLIFLIFWIGIYPKPLMSYINPQTESVVTQVRPDYFRNAPAAQKTEVAKEDADSETQKTESAENK